MSVPPVTLSIAHDCEPFAVALSKAVKAMVAFIGALNAGVAHHDRHHTQELPANSVMHAAYDHRRRARRARRRS